MPKNYQKDLKRPVRRFYLKIQRECLICNFIPFGGLFIPHCWRSLERRSRVAKREHKRKLPQVVIILTLWCHSYEEFRSHLYLLHLQLRCHSLPPGLIHWIHKPAPTPPPSGRSVALQPVACDWRINRFIVSVSGAPISVCIVVLENFTFS